MGCRGQQLILHLYYIIFALSTRTSYGHEGVERRVRPFLRGRARVAGCQGELVHLLATDRVRA